MNCNIVLIGVGGQGTLLASKIIGAAALNMGLDVKLSEVHGMAQRGGSVITHVRFGDKVHAPLVTPGEADYVLAFERLEALRAEHYAAKNGLIIACTKEILPMPVITGQCAYPNEGLIAPALLIEADRLAREAGSEKAVNMVMLGALSFFLGWEMDMWLGAIEQCVPARWLDINLRAFRVGRGAVEERSIHHG